MNKVFINACIIACPQNGNNKEQIEYYVTCLSNILELRDAGVFKFLISCNLYEVLEQSNALPPWANPDSSTYIQKEDVSRLFFEIISNSDIIEDNLKISDILLENMSVRPDYYLKGKNGHIIDNTFRTLGIISFGQFRRMIPERNFILVRDIHGLQIVNVTGTIILVECAKDCSDIQFPLNFGQQIIHVDSTETLIKNFDPILLWKSGLFLYSLKIAIYQRGNSHLAQKEWPLDYPFVFGAGFINSIIEYNFDSIDLRISNLLDACCEAVIKANMSKVHAIRTSKGGAAPQKIRKADQAKAWRRDIDYDYHLHYWDTGAHIEFAVIVMHNDVHIPE